MWFKYVASFGGSIIGMFMVFANLIGFATGYEGLTQLIRLLLEPEGVLMLMFGFSMLWTAVTIMFYIRDKEEEKGENKGY